MKGKTALSGSFINNEMICKNFLQNCKNAVFVVNKNNQVVFASPSCKKIFGYSPKEFMTMQHLTEQKILHPDYRDKFKTFWSYFAKTGTFSTKTSEWEWIKKNGDVIYTENIFVNLSGDGKSAGFLTIAEDITRRKKVELINEQTSSLLHSISRINQLIVKEKDEAVLLQKACEILCDTRGYGFAWIGKVNEKEKTIIPVAKAGPKSLQAKLKKFVWTKKMESYCHVVKAIKSKKIVNVDTLIPPFPKGIKLCEWHKGVIKYGDISCVFMPIIIQKKSRAILFVSSAQPKIFNTQEIKLLKELANDMAFAIASIKTEKIAKEKDVLYKSLVDLSPDTIAVHSGGKMLMVNAAGAKLLKIKNKNDVIGKPVMDFVHPDSRPMVIKRIKKMISLHKSAPPFEEKFLRTDGTVVDVEVSAVPIVYEEQPAIQVVAHDITTRKRAELAVAREAAITQNFIELNPYAIAVGRTDGSIYKVNKAFIRLFGSLPPPTYNIYKDPLLSKAGYKKLFKRALSGEIVEFPKIWYNAHRMNPKLPDKEICIRTIMFPIKGLEGKVEYLVGMHENITQAAEIDKAKTEFVSLASHQLKTPLASIKWFSELLLEKGRDVLTPEQIGMTQEISAANHRMIGLVNALLNVSRIEMGTFSIEPKRFDVVKLVDKCISMFKSKIRKRDLILKKKIDLRSKLINADPEILFIILQNLLSNAIQYTPSGGKITVDISRKNNDLILTVRDTGIGIPLNAQDKIYTKLYRADNAQTVAPYGNGLGFYIIKSILDYLDGRIWFTSKVNKGTTFNVLFPIKNVKRKKGTKTLVAE